MYEVPTVQVKLDANDGYRADPHYQQMKYAHRAGVAREQGGAAQHDLQIRSRNICDPVGGVFEESWHIGRLHQSPLSFVLR